MKKKKWPQNEGGLEKKLGDPSGSNGVPSEYGNTACGVFSFQGQSQYIEVAQGGVSRRAIHNWLRILSIFFAKKIKKESKLFL